MELLNNPEYKFNMNLFDQINAKRISDLEKNLPAYLTYHDFNHTRLVLEKAILIGKMEKITDYELFLLKIAAIFHDTGFTVSTENHEAESCKIAQRELTDLGFAKTEIDKICGMIMATRIPQEPNTHLEEILADADLEYLGTDDFEAISQKLYLEFKHFRPELTIQQWNDIQISFFTKHHYHTEYCRKNREPLKLINLTKLQEKAKLLE